MNLDEQDAPNIWPPAPKLEPPSSAPRSKLAPLWLAFAINMGGSALFIAAKVVEQWYRHHLVLWLSDLHEGLRLFVTLMVLHLFVRIIFTRQEAKAAQELTKE